MIYLSEKNNIISTKITIIIIITCPSNNVLKLINECF